MIDNGHKRIWTIGSGKGGTGKSLVAAGLGLMLSQMGRRVILVDADLGGANLHTCLGIKEPESSLSDFVMRRKEGIEDVIIDTPYKNLKLISGAGEIFGMANPLFTQKKRLLQRIRTLSYDDIIIDIGAGTSYNVLDFFILSATGIIVALPEPTSVENMHRFIKDSLIRIVLRSIGRDLFQRHFKEFLNGRFRDIKELKERCRMLDQAQCQLIMERLEQFRPLLIINQARDIEDIQLGYTIRSLLGKHLGVEVAYLGYIPYDPDIPRAIKRFVPYFTTCYNSPAAVFMKGIAGRLIKGEEIDSWLIH